MKILSATEEKILECILNELQGNNQNNVKVEYDIFPDNLQNNIKKYLDDLKKHDYIVEYFQSLSNINIYLTQEGIDYFINKKKQLFPQNSIDLLKKLLKEENPVNYMLYLFDGLGEKEDKRLRAMMKKLKDDGYIDSSWADDVPYIIEFNEKAYELEENNFRQDTKAVNNIYNFNKSTFNNKVLINSVDNAVINNKDVTELFDKMLEVAININNGEKDLVISTINEMKENVKGPGFVEKYNAFIAAAANHMTLFAPFFPMLSTFFS